MKHYKLKIWKLYVIILIISYSCINTISKEHIIKGDIANYNGVLYLMPHAPRKYYQNNFKKDSFHVIDGEFKFKLPKENKYPLPFYLTTSNDLKTQRFILEPKNQKIIIDSLYFNVKPIIISKNSTINLEEKVLRDRNEPFIEKFRASINAIKNSDTPKESYLKLFNLEREKLSHELNLDFIDFVKEYPNSYFSFWEIVSRQSGGGYKREIETAYNNLSPLIKETKVAKLFLEDLKNAKLLNIGNHFPKINLKNRELEALTFKGNNNTDAEYILVDFWFIYCSPCIAQFPRLKKLYSTYHSKGLEIVGISIDKTSNVVNWNKTIDKHEINWINLLDENAVESVKLSVNKFPTNYLLNKQGEILKKDISLDELEKLLIQYNSKR